MDLTETIVPRSDQLNAEDLLTGPRTFTVEKVTKGSAEQPVDIHLVEHVRRCVVSFRGYCHCGFRTRWRWRYERHTSRPCPLWSES